MSEHPESTSRALLPELILGERRSGDKRHDVILYVLDNAFASTWTEALNDDVLPSHEQMLEDNDVLNEIVGSWTADALSKCGQILIQMSHSPSGSPFRTTLDYFHAAAMAAIFLEDGYWRSFMMPMGALMMAQVVAHGKYATNLDHPFCAIAERHRMQARILLRKSWASRSWLRRALATDEKGQKAALQWMIDPEKDQSVLGFLHKKRVARRAKRIMFEAAKAE